MRAIPRLAALAALPVLLGACSGVRTPLDGLFEPPPTPDAFMVISRAPLEMPTNLALPEPRPGEVSPLDPTPLTDAQVALLGRPVSNETAGAPSPGEQALLDAAGAASSDPDIRTTLVAENDPDRPDQPYKAPTIFALLFGDEAAEPEDVIDASAEARRLALEGVAVPVDPNAELPDDGSRPGDVDADNPELYPAIVRGNRRPTNTFPLPEPTEE